MTRGMTIAELWRFPVKSMRGERLESAAVTARGLAGDRAYALREVESGKIVTAKNVRRYPDLLACRASFTAPPRPGEAAPPARIELPDGTSIVTDDDDAERVLSAHWKCDLAIVRAAPDDFTIDQYHPDIEDVEPAGRRDAWVEQPVGAAYFAAAGVESPVRPGLLFDLFPLTVMTTATLARLGAALPGSRIDSRRFRMNIVVETGGSGFIENDWIGGTVTIGDGVRLRITLPDPRCVMTTLPQEDLPRDPGILKALVEHNRLDLGEGAFYPCAGVFADAESFGTVRVGDAVRVHA